MNEVPTVNIVGIFTMTIFLSYLEEVPIFPSHLVSWSLLSIKDFILSEQAFYRLYEGTSERADVRLRVDISDTIIHWYILNSFMFRSDSESSFG